MGGWGVCVAYALVIWQLPKPVADAGRNLREARMKRWNIIIVALVAGAGACAATAALAWANSPGGATEASPAMSIPRAVAAAPSGPIPASSGKCYLWFCPAGLVKGRYCIGAKASPPCGDNGRFEGECECGSKYRNGVRVN